MYVYIPDLCIWSVRQPAKHDSSISMNEFKVAFKGITLDSFHFFPYVFHFRGGNNDFICDWRLLFNWIKAVLLKDIERLPVTPSQYQYSKAKSFFNWSSTVGLAVEQNGWNAIIISTLSSSRFFFLLIKLIYK